ncbi:hypothetical protein [Streptomyces sp. AM 3-1-1]|uniref:hypothetical protein n=1 Tax=Streptomyces sp. AM 3-1-1 TaxID=3028711 RepID=UPI0023BA1206|nr:hypothetical protein [Streptomyces sp. AM 3-1-1]WEH29070.1 hypothetical protein P0D76_18060 [Streptomyces sp. AM 3-1-1]
MLVLVGAPATARRPAREVLVLVLVGAPATARRPAREVLVLVLVGPPTRSWCSSSSARLSTTGAPLP